MSFPDYSPDSSNSSPSSASVSRFELGSEISSPSMDSGGVADSVIDFSDQ